MTKVGADDLSCGAKIFLFAVARFSLFLGVKTHPRVLTRSKYSFSPLFQFLFAVITPFNSFSPLLQFLFAVITAFLQSRFGPKIPFRISDLAQNVVTICLCDEGT